MSNKPWAAALDGVGNGLGYGLVLVVVAFFKELLGSGTLTIPGLGKMHLLDGLAETTWYDNNGLMVLPPSSLVLVAIYIWIQKSRNKKLIEQ